MRFIHIDYLSSLNFLKRITMMSALIVNTALDYVEFSSVMAFVVLLVCALLSYQVSVRRPLYYNLFVVEMHTWTTRRMVQVLHLGQEFQPSVQWDRLVQRMRARAPRAEGEQRIAISDTNIVIQSPNTVIDSPAPARSPNVDVITLWDIEMPSPGPGHVPDAVRDSQYAAAAAIAILARGDDSSLLTRVLNTSQNQSTTESSSSNTNEAEQPSEDAPAPPSRHDYVTTDVTYTTPSVSSDMHHQISTRMSDISQTREPVNEMIRVEEEEESDQEDDEETGSEDEEESSDEAASVVIEESNDTDVLWANRSHSASSRQSVCSCSQNAPSSSTSPPSIPEEPSQSSASDEKSLIRLKFMNDTERDTYASLEDTVAKFKQDNFQDLSDQTVRLIFQGQLLRDDFRKLNQYGVQNGSVLHCHISNVPYNNNNGSAPAPRPATNRRRTLSDLFFNRGEPQSSAEPESTDGDGAAGGEAEIAEPTNEGFQLDMEIRSERSLGQLFLLVSTIVPILTGLGLAVFRPERLRDAFRPTTLMTISHWMINVLTEFGLMDEDDDETSMHSALMFIICAVSLFLYFTPFLFDRIEYYIASAVFAYVVVVLYARYRRRHPEAEGHDELNENQIVQENIRLM